MRLWEIHAGIPAAGAANKNTGHRAGHPEDPPRPRGMPKRCDATVGGIQPAQRPLRKQPREPLQNSSKMSALFPGGGCKADFAADLIWEGMRSPRGVLERFPSKEQGAGWPPTRHRASKQVDDGERSLVPAYPWVRRSIFQPLPSPYPALGLPASPLPQMRPKNRPCSAAALLGSPPHPRRLGGKGAPTATGGPKPHPSHTSPRPNQRPHAAQP